MTYISFTLSNIPRSPVDHEKLAYAGASGGGWIASGVGMMLAENDLSHLAKF